jgi:hypothetical protein
LREIDQAPTHDTVQCRDRAALDDLRSWIYILRLLAFILIIFAIVRKNQRPS